MRRALLSLVKHVATILAICYTATLKLISVSSFVIDIPSTKMKSSFTGLCSSDKDNHDTSHMTEEQRMAFVRKLQDTFYKSTSSSTSSDNEMDNDNLCLVEPDKLEMNNGVIQNLPLLRAPWAELPGRSNVLNMHEPIYTNMFETIIRSSPEGPWYFGHLYLQNGSRSLPSRHKDDDESNDRSGGSDQFKLRSWRDHMALNKSGNNTLAPPSSSALIGTLTQIIDYRRVKENGRLILYVYGVERFVVDQVKQEIPYSIADVQILPDIEEIVKNRDDDDVCDSSDKTALNSERTSTIIQSLFKYKQYEYDTTRELPIPNVQNENKNNLCASNDFVYCVHELQKMIPLAPYNLHFNNMMLAESSGEKLSLSDKPRDSFKQAHTKGDCDNSRREIGKEHEDQSIFLEKCLLDEKILRYEAPTHPEIKLKNKYANLTIDEIERRLWTCMDQYHNLSTPNMVSNGTKNIISSISFGQVLSLLRPQLPQQDMIDEKSSLLLEEYPSIRRQKRLSYIVSALLEKTESSSSDSYIRQLRQVLLELSSTRSRLCAVLDMYEMFME